MEIQLDVEAGKAPAPVGGGDLAGVKTCCMQLGTFSYFQTGLSLSGRVRWGDFTDEVRGEQGWIDRQFAREHFATYTGARNERHRHEWRVIHLDNGWDMSVWQQFDGERGDRTIPFSGVTAQGPDGEVRYTSEFGVERLSFVKDPGVVRPDRPLAKGAPSFLSDRFHLSVPEWGLALTAEPLVPAPAHGMPIEYWNGPIRLVGQMHGRPVQGVGFHERSKLWFDPFGVAYVLRETLRHLPAGARAEGSRPSPRQLADRVWNCDVLLARKDHAGARRLLEDSVAPGLDLLPSPGREAAREIYDALLVALAR